VALWDFFKRRTASGSAGVATSPHVGAETRSSIKQPEEWLLRAFESTTQAGPAVSADSAMTVSTVFACTRILAEGVAMLPLKLYRRTAAGREEATDHPLYPLLKDAPNVNQTSFEWREMLQGHLCLRGNAYCRIVRDRFFDVVALDPLHPADVQVQKLTSGDLVYRLTGQTRFFTANEILHFRALSNNGLVGISPISLMRESIGLALAIQGHAAKSFSAGNKFPGILKTPASLSPKQIGELRNAWDAQRAGENGAKVPILHGGLDWQSVGMSNVDAELIASGTFQRKDIAEAFRIPLVMLAHGDKSATYASVEQFMLSFVNQTLQPWLERWEQRLNASLLTSDERASGGLYFKFNLKALLRGDAKSRAEFYRLMREMRAMTINEIRDAEEMNDFPDAIGDNPREDFNGQGGRTSSGADAQLAGQVEQTEGDANT
jgi:HK97 family phage portal protein